MSAKRGRPEHGDVESITSEESDRSEGTVPSPVERMTIRLHGHPRTYVVRAVADGRSGPKLTELTIVADDGSAIDHNTLRAVPARRLAYSAAQWLDRAGGRFVLPNDTSEVLGRQPENSDARVHEVARRVDAALALGLPVRRTVADGMNLSTATVDRLIAKAKAEGFLDAAELPKRPQPRQKGTDR